MAFLETYRYLMYTYRYLMYTCIYLVMYNDSLWYGECIGGGAIG